MKKTILILIVALKSSLVYSLEFSQCLPKISSKKYIENDYQSPFPRTVVFSCEYECMRESGIELVLGTSRVELRSISDEAYLTVCQGAIIKKGKWGYELDRVDPFFVYDTRIEELKDWAYSINMPLDTNISKQLLTKFKETLSQVVDSYFIAGNNSDEFLYAAKALQGIEKELPEKTEALDSYIEKIENLQGDISSDFTGENLVLRYLKATVGWRVRL